MISREAYVIGRFGRLPGYSYLCGVITPTILSLALAAVPAVPETLPANLKAEYVQMADSADYYIARQMWLDARRCTLSALKHDPANFNNSLLFSNLGVIDTHLGEYERAVEDFTLGLTIAPASTTLRANRARTLLEMGEYDRADEDLRALLTANGADAWARKMHAVVLMRNSRPDEAYSQLAMIETPDADTLRLMAGILQRKGDTEGALAAYDRLVEASPSDESYADRALYLLVLGDTSGASADIKAGLRVNDKNPTLYLLRAYLRSLMHENALADEDKKMAIRYGIDTQLLNYLFPSLGKRK